MTLVATDAVVLHVFPYLESSRIFRLATRELGVVSVLARGARKSQRRFGTALDLFAGGEAQFQTRPGRDLHTLVGYDVTRARLALGTDLARFAAAAAVAELVLHLASPDEHQPTWYDALIGALDGIAAAPPDAARAAGLAGAWALVAALGVAPSVDDCVRCHEPIPPDRAVRFTHAAGGALCEVCGRFAGPGTRTLPAEARATLRAWLSGDSEAAGALDEATARAHQRLLREFLREHLTDGRPLRAFEAWESERVRAEPPSDPPRADVAPTSAPADVTEPDVAEPDVSEPEVGR